MLHALFGFLFALNAWAQLLPDSNLEKKLDVRADIKGAIKIATETPPKSITLGMIPGDDPIKLKKNSLELAKVLGQKLGVTVNIYISKNYQGLIDAMKAKKVDYAFFTAMSFVFAEKQAGAKVLLKKVWESPFYHSAILVKKNSGVKSTKDLKGKRFGFVDEKSTSGYLYPRVKFKKDKIDLTKDFSKIEFLGNHQEACKALLDGRVDAIAVFADSADGSKSAMRNFYPERVNEVEVLWVSDPIPNDPFVVREDFYGKYPQLTHRIMFAFIDLKEDKRGNLLKQHLGVSEVMMATSRQYDPVRELVKELDLKLE